MIQSDDCICFISLRKLTSFAAAIASNIALSSNPVRADDIPDAVERACRYIEGGIQTSFNLGQGHGPINHFHSMALVVPAVPFKSTLKRRIWRIDEEK